MSKSRPSDPNAIIKAALDDMLLHRPFASMAEAQRFLEAEVRAYNTRPQPELGGLTPSDMHELVRGDWAAAGALRINSALAPNDIGDPAFLFNARAFLTALRDEGPAKATAAGNLSREFVALMLPRMRWRRPGYLDDVRRMTKAINESDVSPLETMRYVLEFAGLVHRRKGFRISPAARVLLDDARSGELFSLLFYTFFRKLDLRSLDGQDWNEGLQQTIAFTFWKLRTEAESWTTPARLVDVAWLDSAKDPELPNQVFPAHARREWQLRSRVIEPLVGFGLLESRDLPKKERWENPIEVRKTPLYDRALLFRFSGSG